MDGASSPTREGRSLLLPGARFVKRNWQALFFALCALGTVYMDVYVARSLLDGDASEYMVRAYTFYQQGNLFSNDYYFTTELRLLNPIAFFYFFFCLFSDWTLVRVCGTVAIQALYVLTFAFLVRQAGGKKKTALLAAGFLLMPFSTNYGRIALYHVHYTLYLASAFLLLGIALRLAQPGEGRRRRALCAVYFLLWAYNATNGVRVMMIVGAPLLVMALWNLMAYLRGVSSRTDVLRGLPWKTEPALRLMVAALVGALGFMAGYTATKLWIAPYYHLTGMDGGAYFYPYVSADVYIQIWNGFLECIGTRNSRDSLVSLRGVSLVLAVGSFAVLMALSFRAVFLPRNGQPHGKRMLSSFFAFSFLVTTLIFCLDSKEQYYRRYYVPVVAMALLTLAVEWDGAAEAHASLAKRLLSLFLAFAFLFQGGYSAWYMLHKQSSSWDTWSGMEFPDSMAVEALADCDAFMRDKGYTHAMMPYWYASVLTEISGGRIAAIPCSGVQRDGTVSFEPWGCPKSAFERRNLPDELIVFIADGPDIALFESRYPLAELVHQGDAFNGYLVPTDVVMPAAA